MERSNKIVKISILGIVVNIILVIFKLMVGVLSNSIAIVLDAVNNFSDALSSVITIIGTKIAAKAPDKEHPFGYGRSEYISSVAIALIILFAGLSALKESVEKIFSPEDAQYSYVTVIVIVTAVVVKFVFGQYLKKVGNEINAHSLVASGTDAVMDSVVSIGTLVSAGVSIVWQINIDGILGAIISAVILKAGIEILKETLDSIIGARVDSRFAAKIKEQINTHKGVHGAYDLVLHDYGPNEMIGSVHIEVADDTTAKEIDVLSRAIVADIYTSFGVLLTIGIYASNTTDERYLEMKHTILKETRRYEEILQLHGFYADAGNKRVSFDLVMDYAAKEPERIIEELKHKLKELYSEYEFFIIRDSDYSD